jgi:hypothetical protein
MTGRVVCFRPRLQRGIVRLECGDELPFETDVDAESIHGDDVVEFALQENGTGRIAKVIRIVEKGTARAADYRSMLRQLFGAAGIHKTST